MPFFRAFPAASPLAPSPLGVSPGCPSVGTPGGSSVPPCQVSGSGVTQAASNKLSIIALGAGGIFMLVTLGSIAVKYRKYNAYMSFWGRILALAVGAFCAFQALSDYSTYSANQCSSSDNTGSCPNQIGVLLMGATALFHMGLNLPFLYASESQEKKWYATFGLFKQSNFVSSVCGGGAGISYSMGGGILQLIALGSGMGVSALFMYGWSLGEDGAFQRLLDSAKEGLDAVGKAAEAMVDDSLKIFGLDAGNRKKVSSDNIYLHARVQRGPDWIGGDEDGGDGNQGELFGFYVDGRNEGKKVLKGEGYAAVKWDDKHGVSGKWGEYRIGAGGKFDLISVDAADDAGILSSALGFFGFGGTQEEGEELSSSREQLDIFFGCVPNKGVAAKCSLWLEVFDESLSLKGVANEETKGFFRGSVRHREMGAKTALVVELNKLPDDAKFLVLSCRLQPGAKLKEFGTPNMLIKAVNREIPDLTLDSSSLEKKFLTHGSNEAYICWLFFKLKPKGDFEERWFAAKPHQAPFSPGRGSIASQAINEELSRLKAKRDDKKFVADCVNIHTAILDQTVEGEAESKAKEAANKQIDEMATKYEQAFVKQGKPAPMAKVLAKKFAALQFQKIQGAKYKKVLQIKLVGYVRAGKSVPVAQALAKKDAMNEVLFGNSKDALIKEARAHVEEDEANAKAKVKQQEEEYKNSYAGMAWGLIGAGPDEEEEDDESKKKKKKKKDK